MNPVQPPPLPRPRPRVRAGYVVLGVILTSLVLGLVGVTGYFRLGSETTILRESLMHSVSGHWEKKIALHVGGFTTALVRAGSRCVKLPPEPRAALDSLYGIEVGVYNLHERTEQVDRARILSQADKAMAARGWERTVGVFQDGQLVAIYLPRKLGSVSRLKCALMVFTGRELVVASVRGNPEPLLELAANHL